MATLGRGANVNPTPDVKCLVVWPLLFVGLLGSRVEFTPLAPVTFWLKMVSCDSGFTAALQSKVVARLSSSRPCDKGWQKVISGPVRWDWRDPPPPLGSHMLYYITLNYIILHYIILYQIILYHIKLHYTILYYIIFCYIII